MANLIHSLLFKNHKVNLVSKTYRPAEKDDMDGNLYEITEYLFICADCGFTHKEVLNGKEVV